MKMTIREFDREMRRRGFPMPPLPSDDELRMVVELPVWDRITGERKHHPVILDLGDFNIEDLGLKLPEEISP